MAINWETVLVALTTGIGAGALTHIVGPIISYQVDKRATRLGWRREAINQTRDYLSRCLENPELYDNFINTDSFTRLVPHLKPVVVKYVETNWNTISENHLPRPEWADLLLLDLARLENAWGL